MKNTTNNTVFLMWVWMACIGSPAWSADERASTQVASRPEVTKTNAEATAQLINGIGTAKFATVALPVISFRYGADEIQARQFGCTFSTSSTELIASLVSLVNENVEAANPPKGPWMAEPKEVVYLTLANGEKIRFEFEPLYINRNEVRGRVFRGENVTNIRADLSVPRKLHEWAARAEEHKPVGDIFIQSKKVCEYVRQYKGRSG